VSKVPKRFFERFGWHHSETVYSQQQLIDIRHQQTNPSKRQQGRRTTSTLTSLLSSPLMAASNEYPAGKVAGAVTWIIKGKTLPFGFRGVAMIFYRQKLIRLCTKDSSIDERCYCTVLQY